MLDSIANMSPCLTQGRLKLPPTRLRLGFPSKEFILYFIAHSVVSLRFRRHNMEKPHWIIGRPAQVSAILSSERAKDIPKLRDENGSRAHI